MRDLRFIQACPDDDYYIWQTHLWLESLREIGKSEKAISLIFTPSYRESNKKWEKLQELYPESEFFFYKDKIDKIDRLIGIYIPIIRPFILMKYFELHPEMKEKAIFYCDCDILFTNKFNIDKYLNDDICYLSDTNSYINASYFDSKIKDVKQDKLEDYKLIDVLDETCKLAGINREIALKNNSHSGGAQYLLKNIDSQFWKDVLTNCIRIRLHLQNVNKVYFENENKGFQSWCADMWAVLWTLWKKNQETKVIPEMDFAWSSDSIEVLNSKTILHNAGIVDKHQTIKKDGLEIRIPTFFKGDYHQGKDPFTDPHLEFVYNDERSKTLCNHYYVTKLINLKNKYNL